jgi:hypothetical protein
LRFNEAQGANSRALTLAAAPLLVAISRLPKLPNHINDDPPKNWKVPITAPMLREPVTPQARRYGQVGDFDEGKDAARDALAQGIAAEASKDAYSTQGLGDQHTEASLRYEHQARLRAARARGEISDEEDARAAVSRMLAENPNATDHSTILTNPMHSEKVLAYDVAVGWLNPSKIRGEDLMEFRRFAHWMMVNAFELDVVLKNRFLDYWLRGFYNDRQLHKTYTMEHMTKNAAGIADQRERSLMGYLKQ